MHADVICWEKWKKEKFSIENPTLQFFMIKISCRKFELAVHNAMTRILE